MLSDADHFSIREYIGYALSEKLAYDVVLIEIWDRLIASANLSYQKNEPWKMAKNNEIEKLKGFFGYHV